MENYFTQLNNINVNEHVEKKGNLSYLSWAWAWAEVKKLYPDATYTVYEQQSPTGIVNYFTDGRTCWVKTGVTINGIEHIEMLPIMDYKNRSIPLEDVTSFNVNTAIQRSLTKAVARHGLGLYIYAGEDLPQEEQEAKDKEEKKEAKDNGYIDTITSDQFGIMDDLLTKIQALKDADTRVRVATKICKKYGASSIATLPKDKYDDAVIDLRACIEAYGK